VHKLFDQPSADHQLGGDWLGMTVARYNIGASPPTPADYAQLDYHVRDRFGNPCPKLGLARQVPSPGDPGGGMDLGRDSRQLNVLATADDILHQQGATPVYEAFANSPPWWMTVSGCPTGNPPGIDNLAADQYKTYADYLVNVIHQFHQGFQVMIDGTTEHKGLDFATLEPFNEPAGGLPWAGDSNNNNNQEGANFSLAAEQGVLDTLCSGHTRRAALGTTEISVPDENRIDRGAVGGLIPNLGNGAIDDYDGYSQAAKDCVDQINTHGYTGFLPYDGKARPALAQLAARGRKRLWMSEFGWQTGIQDIADATTYATQVAKDLQYLRPEVWVNWQALEAPSGWGLLEAQAFPEPGKVMPTKTFYALAQFTQFIRPGFSILRAQDANDGAQGTLSVAAEDPATNNLILVTVNDTTGQRSVTYDLAKVGISAGSVKAYRTTLAGNIEAAHQDLNVSRSSFEDAHQAGQSITTYVVSPSSRQSAATSVPDPCQLLTATDLQAVTGLPTERNQNLPSLAGVCYYDQMFRSPNGRILGSSSAKVTVDAFSGDLATATGGTASQLTPIPGIGEQAFLVTGTEAPFGTPLHEEVAFKRHGLVVIIEVQGSYHDDGSPAPPPPSQLEELAKRAAERIR
jgi:hypothetical protein